MSADGGPRWRRPPGANSSNRVGGRRLKRVNGSMRAGASVVAGGVERNLEKRRIESKARRGSGIAWREGEVKGDIRCQTVALG